VDNFPGTVYLPAGLLVEMIVNTILQKGHSVSQLVGALRYKPEGRGFDSQWFYWIFY
jgi:hypothetical protein